MSKAPLDPLTLGPLFSHLMESTSTEPQPLVSIPIKEKKSTRSRRQRGPTAQRRRWTCIATLLTFWVPDFVLRKLCKFHHPAVRQAWREKFALNLLIWGLCATLLFYIIGLTRIICPRLKVMSQGELDGKNTTQRPFVSLYGSYYRIDDVVKVIGS